MFLLDTVAILLLLAAAFGVFNHHVLKLPFAIGMLVSGLLASFGVLGFDLLIPSVHLAETIRTAVLRVDFAAAVLSGMLSLLLFAGALHTDLHRLRSKFTPIIVLATAGVIISTVVVGFAAHLIFGLFDVEVALSWCLVFGALISPTDPIAVLGIMKAAGAPKDLEIKVIGESLFNDGVGVVVFSVLLGVAVWGAGQVTAGDVAVLLAKEVLGGLALGVFVGFATERVLRSLDEPNLEILITLAAVLGLNFAASHLHLSGPLAAVVAGLMLGNQGRARAMSARTQSSLDTVWMFIDETLNALLFLLIGVEVLAIDSSSKGHLLAALALIPAGLAARWISVALPLAVLSLGHTFARGTVRVLTWGGLKGGISIALAMKMPEFPGRNAILTATYGVVVFSIVVQGLSVGRLIRRLMPDAVAAAEPPQH